eukprot:364466-Chlamydomonas_euryale.AAC.19
MARETHGPLRTTATLPSNDSHVIGLQRSCRRRFAVPPTWPPSAIAGFYSNRRTQSLALLLVLYTLPAPNMPPSTPPSAAHTWRPNASPGLSCSYTTSAALRANRAAAHRTTAALSAASMYTSTHSESRQRQRPGWTGPEGGADAKCGLRGVRGGAQAPVRTRRAGRWAKRGRVRPRRRQRPGWTGSAENVGKMVGMSMEWRVWLQSVEHGEVPGLDSVFSFSKLQTGF